MAIISEKEIEHLAELSRIELADEEKGGLAGDLEKILKHFEELKEVDTNNVSPMNGGTLVFNAMREDEISETGSAKSEINEKEMVRKSFPEEKDGFLKVPPVFE